MSSTIENLSLIIAKVPVKNIRAIESVALSCSFRVQLFGASPKPLFAPHQLSVKNLIFPPRKKAGTLASAF